MCVLRAMQSIFEAKCDRSNKNNLSSFRIFVQPAENHHSYDFFFSMNADIYVDASLFFYCCHNSKWEKTRKQLIPWLSTVRTVLWYDLAFCVLVSSQFVVVVGEAFKHWDLDFRLHWFEWYAFHLSLFMTICTCARNCVTWSGFVFVFFCVWRQIPVSELSTELLPLQY